MTQQVYGKSSVGTPAENYQRFFVPSIGAPVAVHQPASRWGVCEIGEFH